MALSPLGGARPAWLAGGLAAGLAVLLTVVTAGCGSSPGPVRVAPPSPVGGDAARCARVSAKLPARVGTHSARDVQPRSDRTAAWGDPAIVLICGVGRPAGLRGGTETAPLGINGVAWLESAGRDAVAYTVIDRGVFVRVNIPKTYQGESSVLIDLSDAISAALPRRPIPL